MKQRRFQIALILITLLVLVIPTSTVFARAPENGGENTPITRVEVDETATIVAWWYFNWLEGGHDRNGNDITVPTASIQIQFPNGQKATTFCADMAHSSRTGMRYRVSDEQIDCRVKWIMHHYPSNISGSGASTTNISGRQAAIWHFTDGYIPPAPDHPTDGAIGMVAWDIIAEVNAITDDGANQTLACDAFWTEAPTLSLDTNAVMLDAGQSVDVTVTAMQGDTPLANLAVNVSSTFGNLSTDSITTGPDGTATFTVDSSAIGMAYIEAQAQYELPIGTILRGLDDTEVQKLVLGEVHVGDIFADASVSWQSVGDISVRIFHDRNMNGIQDGSGVEDGSGAEANMEGWTVELLDEDGNVIETSVTDSSGLFNFAELPNGTYTIRYTLEDSWSATSEEITQTVVVDNDSHYVEFGVIRSPVIIVNIFHDEDRDGVWDEDESPLENWDAILYREDGSSIVGMNGSTNEDGQVILTFPRISDFTPGNYYVWEDITLHQHWYPTNGVISQTISDLTDNDTVVLYFGNYYAPPPEPATVSGVAWNDANRDGIQDEGETGIGGMTVNLYAEDGTFVGSTTTSDGSGTSGNCLLTQHQVCFGFEYLGYQDNGDDTTTLTFEAINHCPTPVNYVAFGTNDWTTVSPSQGAYNGDLGNYNVAWTGYNNNPGFPSVKHDTNGEDFFNNNSETFEIVVEGFDTDTPVQVQGHAGRFLEDFQFDLDDLSCEPGADVLVGYYEFVNLIPDDYYVEFELPDGSVFSPVNQGNDDSADSDVNPTTGTTDIITLLGGDNVGNVDAGIFTPDFNPRFDADNGSPYACIINNQDGTYTSHFGYENPNDYTLSVPIGIQNYFSPGEADRGQILTFQPGVVEAWPNGAFSVDFDGSDLTWTLMASSLTVNSEFVQCLYFVDIVELWYDGSNSQMNNPPISVINQGYKIIATSEVNGIPKSITCSYNDDGELECNGLLPVPVNGSYIVSTPSDMANWDTTGTGTFEVGEACIIDDSTGVCIHTIVNRFNDGDADQCWLYGVDDQAVTDSQFFKLDMITGEFDMLGSVYPGIDVEGVGIHPRTKELYAAGGDSLADGGPIYKVNKRNGSLILLGETGHGDQVAASFNPADNNLWVMVENEGLYIVNIEYDGTLADAPSTLQKSLSNIDIESLAWNPDGTLLYGGDVNNVLWVYNPDDTLLTQHSCALPDGQAGGLEFNSSGDLIGTLNSNQGEIELFTMDLETCQYQTDVYPIPAMGNVAPDVKTFDFEGTCGSPPSSLTIIKNAEQSPGTDFDFYSDEESIPDFSLKHDESRTFIVDSGRIMVGEDDASFPDHWSLETVICTTEDGGSRVETGIDHNTLQAYITIGSGQNIICLFRNKWTDFETSLTPQYQIFLPLIIK